MIIYTKCNNEKNIIHLIVGPETTLQLDIEGVLFLDIEKIRSKFPNPSLPVQMMITRSEDEAFTTSHLKEHVPMGNESLTPDAIKDKVIDMLSNKDKLQKKVSKLEEEKKVDPRGSYIPNIQCPQCKQLGVFLKPGLPAFCGDCFKIEFGLGNIENKDDNIN